MKKLLGILNCGLFGRNGALLCAIIAFVLTGLFAASCAKSEIAQDESVANAAQSGTAAEGQDDPAGDDQGNPDDPNPGDPSDPSVPVGPVQPGDDYISPDHFNMVQLTFGACADAEDNPSQTPAQAGAFGTKGLFTPEEAASREEFLDDEPTKTYLSDVKEAGGQKKQYIYWSQGDKIKIYYTEGKQNFSDGTIKHGGKADSTIDGWVNKEDDYYYAFYPNRAPGDYPIESSVSYEGNGSFTVTVPAVQNGDFGHCHMAVGKATKAEKQFAFTNVGSYIKLKVANTTATAITIQATNTSDKIVGTFTVPFAAEGLGIDEKNITYGECSCSLRVNLPKPRAANLDVYVALLPNVNFSDGFRIRYEYDEDGDGVDDAPHPGFAYVKRTGGARAARSVERKKILNFATVSVPTLDDRIIENYFVTTSGAGSKNGSSWGNALGTTELFDLLSQPVDGSGNQIDDEDYDRAWKLDGATIHMAAGEYALPATSGKNALKMEYTDYTRQVKVKFLGAYQTGLSGTATPARDTSRYVTAFKPAFATDGAILLGNQTDVTFDGFTFKDMDTDNPSRTTLYASAGDGNATLHLNSCIFSNNKNGDTRDAAACQIVKCTAVITKCTFTGNYARNGSSLNVNSTSANVSVSNCKFDSNSTFNTSGAVQNGDGVLNVKNCVFSNNDCWHKEGNDLFGAGGAFHANSNTSTASNCVTHFTHCLFDRNSGRCAGAISLQIAEVTCEDCRFTGNQALYLKNEKNEDNPGHFAGGAIRLFSSTSQMTLTDCTFSGNSAPTSSGGAITLLDAGANLTINGGTTFSENYCLRSGGAIASKGNLTITGTSSSSVAFTHNYTTDPAARVANGGALHLTTGSHSDLDYVAFTGNVAGSGASNNYSNGGGIYTENVTSFTADNCTFTGHLARNGGGVQLYGTGGSCATCYFTDCNFTNNWCDDSNTYFDATIGSCNFHGGAVCVQGVPAVFSKCSFSGNTAYNGSGAIHINNTNSAVTCSDCTFSDNSTGSDASGGAVMVEYGSFTASDTSFERNSAKDGGAIYSSQALSLTDCILDNNSARSSAAAIYVAGDLTIAGTDTLTCAIRNHGTTSSRTPGSPVIYGASSTISLDHCKINDNHFTSAGGTAGFFPLGDQTLSATDCVFVDNTSSSNCNGLFAALTTPDAGSITLVRTSVRNCSGDSGAALYIGGGIQTASGTAVSITGGDFKGNSTNAYGGAVNCTNDTKDKSTVTITINGTLFRGNTAYNGGGAIHANSSYDASERVISLYDCTFDRNRQTRTDAGDGAGAVNVNIGRLNVSGCTFEGNRAAYGNGGAIRMGSDERATYNMTWNPARKRSVFLNNSAPGQGGALAFLSTGTPATITLENAQFTGNTSGGAGGAVYFAPAKELAFKDCGFNGNSVTGADAYGDAIACINGTSLSLRGDNYEKNHIIGHTSTYPIYSPACTSYTFTNHEFKNNTSTRDGCMINLSGNSSFAITGCSITGNSAPNGGVIYADLAQGFETESTISGSTLSGNTATDAASLGGAIYWNCASWSNGNDAQRLRIYGNSVLSGNQAGKGGSAIYLNVGRVYLVNSSVTENKFASYTTIDNSYGGAIYMNSSYSKIDVEACNISNNLSDGAGGAFHLVGGRLFMKRSKVNNNRTYSRGGAIYQTGADGFFLVSQCSLVGNYLTKTSDWWGSCYHCNGGTNTYGMFINSTIADGDTPQVTAMVNGRPNLLMCNCTLVGNNSIAALRVEGGKNGILLNNIILNNGSGDAILHSGNYTWSNIGGYNVLGSVNQNGKTVTNIPTDGSLNDKTGKVVANFGSWAWNAASGYYSWDGTLDGAAATSTPIVVSTDYISVGLKTGFNYSVTFNDSKDMNVNASNLGNRIVATWCGSNYYYDQRATDGLGDRRVAGCNIPGAIALDASAVNIGGGGQYSSGDINQNDYVY